MIRLTEAQAVDLRELQQLCNELKAELVIIGAVAYQYNFPNEERHTSDIDIAVALDLDRFADLGKRLQAVRWSQVPGREHRWRSSRSALIDLLPAGAELRKAKQVTWPVSQLTMSLVGFDHVFSESELVEIANGLMMRIITAPVLMLLKIVAFMDDPAGREKDLYDIRAMLALHQADSDRVYSEQVLHALLPDISLAPAFLLGMDLCSLCTLEELMLVHQFLALICNEDKPARQAFLRAARTYSERVEDAVNLEVTAFARGLKMPNQ